jgi:hypothetical protein
LISNIIDYKLDDCLSEIKENVAAGSSKKQLKDLTLKTVDLEKYFLDKDTSFARPRVYPQMEVNLNNDDDTLIPTLENGGQKGRF